MGRPDGSFLIWFLFAGGLVPPACFQNFKIFKALETGFSERFLVLDEYVVKLQYRDFQADVYWNPDSGVYRGVVLQNILIREFSGKTLLEAQSAFWDLVIRCIVEEYKKGQLY